MSPRPLQGSRSLAPPQWQSSVMVNEKRKRWREMISGGDESSSVTWHSWSKVKDRPERVGFIFTLSLHCLACRDGEERGPEKQCEIRLWIYLLSLSSFSLLPKEEGWLTDASHHHHLLPRLWASFVKYLPSTGANLHVSMHTLSLLIYDKLVSHKH